MAQLNLPSSPSVYTRRYSELLGVDFTSDRTQVKHYHSPDMVNMISDKGGYPVKRVGIRSVGDAPDKMAYSGGRYYTISRGVSSFTIKEVEWSGYSLVTVSENTVLTASDKFNSFFAMDGYLWAKSSTLFVKMDIDTEDITVIDITEEVGLPDTSIVPTTLISLKPDGTDGAVLDDVNLLTPYQMNTFIGDGTSNDYVLSSAYIGEHVTVEVMQADGTWASTPFTLGTPQSVSAKNRDGTTYTETIYEGTVTITTPPSAPIIAGQDNVRITFSSFDMTEEAGVKIGFYREHLQAIMASEVFFVYNSRFFVTDYERIYYSNLNNPTIISDVNWFDVDDEVMGFSPFGNYLAIVCRSNGNSTVFLASPVSLEDQTSAYKIELTSSGVGAVAKGSFDNLNDEPLFVSQTGIYTLLTNWYSKNFTYNRSEFINRTFTKEPNLQNAVCVTCDSYYYVAINGKMYVLDGRVKTKNDAGVSCYESYYFDNMPTITDMFCFENKMFMVDANNLYVWNDDIDGITAYTDYGTVVDGKITGGQAISAKWSSSFDGDKKPEILKTLLKKGTMFSLAPYSQTGAKLTLIKDGDDVIYVGEYKASSFSWESIDFSNFSFDANYMVKDSFVRKKVKKYKRIQIILENDDIEPFGIIEVIKSYTYGNYAKR